MAGFDGPQSAPVMWAVVSDELLFAVHLGTPFQV